MEKLEKKRKKEQARLDQEEQDARSEENFGNSTERFADFEDLLSDSDTMVSRLNDPEDDFEKISTINQMRIAIGEKMGAFFMPSQTCLIRRAVQQSMQQSESFQQDMKIQAGKNTVEMREILPIDIRPIGSKYTLSVSEASASKARRLASESDLNDTIFGWSTKKL